METKIPFYNLINIFLLGVLFTTGLAYVSFSEWSIRLVNYDHLLQMANQWQFILSLVVIGIIYEVGVIINRISSIIVEPLCEKWGWIPKKEDNYALFDLAREDHPFLYTLSREYGFSRGNLTLWLILLLLFWGSKHWIEGAIALLLSILFFFSMRKFSFKIQNLLKDYINEK